jgi:branched-chain amino acid transport system permease protein
VTGQSLLGVPYSSSWQVYCLVVAWTAIAAFLMRLQTHTPLGRMANAQRDNFERTQFVGYDPRMIRFYQFTLSGFFAGIAGALYVLVYEIVTFDTVGAAKSATALLATYIGGAGGFFGPILGTVVVVLLQSGVSLISNAWLLYVGVLFIVMVMFAPGGIMGIVARHQPIAQIGRLGELVVPYARILVPGLLSVIGFVILVELAQLTTIGAAQNKSLMIAGQPIDPHSALPWAVGALALIGGGLWLRREARFFRARWDALIEDAKARGLPV